MFRKKQKRNKEAIIDPEDIFFDVQNVSKFDEQQFEGVIQKPLGKNITLVFIVLILVSFLVFFIRLWDIQITDGALYFRKAEDNRLNSFPIFAERGVIFDRNGIALVKNETEEGIEGGVKRVYKSPGFSHLLGYVKYPERDRNGYFWRKQITGISGIEKTFDEELRGRNGAILIEVNAHGEEEHNNRLLEAISGENVHLTIDSAIQTALYNSIQDTVESGGFNAGSAVILNVGNGEVVAATNYPEFDNNLLSLGKDKEGIKTELYDKRNRFLNRAFHGLYSPGSTVKPFIALAALHEEVITTQTNVMSTGTLIVPNIYNPDKPSIFRDWRPGGHGRTDIFHAIADSVNTFFYIIGGGRDGTDGLGIDRIHATMTAFGLGEVIDTIFFNGPSGTVPSRDWKQEIFDERWYLGDTYNTSIGQFGFITTPIHMAVAVAAIANRGELVTPTLTTDGGVRSDLVDIIFSDEEYNIIHRAMRRTVTHGTARTLSDLGVKIAGKTGTAQVGKNNEFVNSWFIGFYPYDEPKYAIALVLERGTTGGQVSAAQAVRQMFMNLEKEEEKVEN